MVCWVQSQKGKGFCSRFSSVNEGMRLGEERIGSGGSEGCVCIYCILVALEVETLGLAEVACWGWGLEQSNDLGKKNQRGKVYGIHRRWRWGGFEGGDREGCHRCSAEGLEMRLRDWLWVKREKRPNVFSSYGVHLCMEARGLLQWSSSIPPTHTFFF